MRSLNTLLIAGVLSVSLGAGVVFETAIANQPTELAQAPAPPPPPPAARPRPEPGRFIEGRLAFLKTELKITDQQQALWDAVAKVMRDQSAERAAVFRQMQASRGQTLHAPDVLERRAAMAQKGAEQTQALLAVVKPLYAAMSDEQKATADMLLAPGRMGHGRPFRRG
jgi:hypothetical protein